MIGDDLTVLQVRMQAGMKSIDDFVRDVYAMNQVGDYPNLLDVAKDLVEMRANIKVAEESLGVFLEKMRHSHLA